MIAGEWRRRKLLQTPAGDATRPTADRTRETLFSMLASRLGAFEGLARGRPVRRVGRAGLEALSRGAASCLFVEQDPAAIRASRANIAKLRARRPMRRARRLGAGLGPARAAARPDPARSALRQRRGRRRARRLLRLGWIGEATGSPGDASESSLQAARGDAARSARREHCCGCASRHSKPQSARSAH